VKFTLLLADSAQVDQNGKVHVLGLGWGRTTTPTPPMALVGFAELPSEQLPTEYSLRFELLDANHEPAKIPLSPDGGDTGHLAIEGSGTATNNPALGTPQQEDTATVPIAITIGPGIALSEGIYYFRGTFTPTSGQGETVLVRFRVVPPDQAESGSDDKLETYHSAG
jgi:hypothetical protein